MPQLIAIAVVGAGLYAGYRWLSRTMADAKRVSELAEADRRRRAAEANGEPRNLGALELDPATGEYRPRGREI